MERPVSSRERTPKERFDTVVGRVLLKLAKWHGSKKSELTLWDEVKVIGICTAELATLGAAVLALNYARTRYEVTKVIAPATREKVYTHSDETTSQILNALSGKGEWPDSIKRELYRREVTRVSKFLEVPLPDNFETLSTKELTDTLTSIIKEYKSKHPNQSSSRFETMSPEERAKWALERTVPRYTYNKKLYDALWKLEVEAGSPMVRLAGTEESILREAGQSYYDPFTNTAYIHIGEFANSKDGGSYSGDPIDNLVGEWTHSYQFNTNPVGSAVTGITDTLRSFINTYVNSTSYATERRKDYETPGTLEYGHQVIEPKFREKVDEASPKQVE